MKRIILIILICFSLLLCTGCSNYNELNDLAIVSVMGIEKQNENYLVSLEIFKEEKEPGSGASRKKRIVITGEGKSLDEAVNNASFVSEKLLFFTHIEGIIIDAELASEGISGIMDYLSRSTDYSFVSYITISEKEKPSKLLKSKEIKNEIVGDAIVSLFNNTQLNNSAFIYNRFFELLEQYVNPNKDIFLPFIKITEGYIEIYKVGIFKGSKMVNKLDNIQTRSISLLNGNNNALYYRINENSGYLVAKIFDSKTKIKVDKNNITINIATTSGLDEVNSEYDTISTKNIFKLDKKIEDNIKKDVINLINFLKENNSDVLGINNKIYKKYGKIEKDWKEYNYVVEVKNTITKKGLLMDPVRGDNEKD